MSLFPRTFTQELSPFFRMMDDYASLTRDMNNFTSGPAWKSMRSFQPKFDVAEMKDGYQLHGELPGIDQKDVSIEWTDGNTLTISGRTETRHEEGSPEEGKVTEASEASESNYEKPSVEDDGAASGQPTSTELTKAPANEVAQEPQRKYWVSERSVGEFHRSFSFPARVDQDAVKASLKNGVLEVTVPKAQKPEKKRIEIQ